jgi:hypothetical protein
MIVKRYRISGLIMTALLVIGCITYFTRDRLAGTGDIMPECLQEPVQKALAEPNEIHMSRNGYEYSITPLYDYAITGLVVGRRDYDTWYSISRADKTFPLDLCIIWGENLRSQVFRERGISFSQDTRHCYVWWRRDVGFRMEDLSNNHLLVDSTAIEKKLSKIRNGDQVRISGKLVNIKAKPDDRAASEGSRIQDTPRREQVHQ